MKFRIILSLIVAFSTLFGIHAQEKSQPKKVIIIKKTEDNGKITESRQEAEGEEAEALLKSIDSKDIDMVNVEKGEGGKNVIKIVKSTREKVISNDGDKDKKEIEISSELKDGKTTERYKIIKKDSNGEKVMEWDGTGEMPADLKKELGNININKNIDGENMEIILDNNMSGNGEDKIIIIDQNKEHKKDRLRINRPDNGFFGKSRDFDMDEGKPNNNKVTLGVMIENTDDGVEITDIVEGSAAAGAGLRRGDILLKINERYIFTINSLLDALHPFNSGEKIKVKYIRAGKEKSTSAVLKGRN